MPDIPLRDILIKARQESVQMKHHYLGVEHLFIALLQIRGGIATGILEAHGLSPNFVIDAIRRKAEGGKDELNWAGLRHTPRANVVLDIARDIALDKEIPEITERELLNAIVDERDSLPIRVLQSIGINIDALSQSARTFQPLKEPLPPDISVSFGEECDPNISIEQEQLFVLKRMFPNHSHLRIERRLMGFRRALILVVTPMQVDGRPDSAVVVKIDQTDSIQDEFQRYETHVKFALPLMAARLVDSPTTPGSSELAGLKYTLVTPAAGNIVPEDFRTRVRSRGLDELGRLIQQTLFGEFRETWWQAKRAFRFEAWQEYDWLLPPILTLDFIPEAETSTNIHILRFPFINRTKLKAKLRELETGDLISVENFKVQRFDRTQDVLRLATGFGSEADKRAYKIDVRGANQANYPFFLGETVGRIVGRVWKTRHDIMMDHARDLLPEFDLNARWIPMGGQLIPNPLPAYEDLLDQNVNGSMSKIHGDLHLGNILGGPKDSIWLIDFGNTRDGHSLFDWANLEVSILGDAVMPVIGDSWEKALLVMNCLMAMESKQPLPTTEPTILAGIETVRVIRQIVEECLTTPGHWFEYYLALALCALRGITWDKMPLGARRLMLLLAGAATLELNRKYLETSHLQTPSPEATETLPAPISAEQRAETIVGQLIPPELNMAVRATPTDEEQASESKSTHDHEDEVGLTDTMKPASEDDESDEQTPPQIDG